MEPDRGEKYADGGVEAGTLCWPDPKRMLAIRKEWEDYEKSMAQTEGKEDDNHG